MTTEKQSPGADLAAAWAPSPTLWGYMRAHVGAYLLGALMLATFQLAMNRIDWLSKTAIDIIFGRTPGKVPHDAAIPAGIMLVLAIVGFITRVTSRWFSFNAGRDIEYTLRGQMLSSLHRVGQAYFRKMSAGEIMSRATNDLTQVRLLTGFGVLNVINVMFAFASALQIMLAISGKLTMVSLLMLPLLLMVTRGFSGRLFQRTRQNQEALGKLTECVQSNLAGVRVVRSFGMEAQERARFGSINQDYLKASLSLARLRGAMMPITGAVSALGMLLFFWYGSSLLLKGPEGGGISEGGFFAFSLALGRMTWPMIAMGFVLSIVQRGRVSFERLKQILDAKPEIVDGPLPPLAKVNGELKVTGLSFRYGDRVVLDDVRFTVPAGGSVAIVGRTGAGKSTLAMLLARLLPTPPGTVFIDGYDVCELPLHTVRTAIGYAQQDAFLFSTTVARNIGFALDDPDSPTAMQQIRAAAREAQVLTEIEGLPEQMDTIVGERGVQLSGGQKQRVALGRALLWQPPLLVLDDPLSAVDAKTEAAILDSIERQAARRSVVLITHRVAAAASRCQRVVVLDRGRVIEQGTHQELLALRGVYAGFAEEQKVASELEEFGLGDEPVPGPALTGSGGIAMSQATRVAKPEPSQAEQKLRAFHEEDALKKSYDFQLLRRLWPFIRPHLRHVIISLLTLLALAGLNLMRPRVMGMAVTHAGAKQAGLLVRDGALLAGLVAVSQVFMFAQMYSMQLAGALSMADLRQHVFAFMQELSLRFFDRTPVGRLVTRATNDVDAVSELFASGVLNAIGDMVMLIGIVVAMLALDWQLALIAFAALPVVGVLVYFVRQGSKRAYRDIRTKTARLNAFLNEQVGGIAIVQAYGREAATAREFDEINLAYREANKRSIYYEAILDAAIEMISTLCIASVLWWVGVQKLGSRPVTFALLVMFTQYIKQFFEPISMLSQRYTVLQSALSGAERIFQLLDETDREELLAQVVAPVAAAVDGSPAPAPAPGTVPPADEALALDHVSFEYKPGVPVLREVSLQARRGEKIALVGATGAGKSTVASLALRLYPVKTGVVRVMGRDVRTYGRDELRAQFSVVPQDVFLFGGTVLSNIAMGDPKADEGRALRALQDIGAQEIFERRGGLNARVDDRGSNFSAGERQLLAFARAIYRNAPILILDEATASIDSDTEARLQTALQAVMRGRTALVIAHRLSTIQAANRIVVFHKGRVVEDGTHDELIARGGVYARLYQLQFAAENRTS